MVSRTTSGSSLAVNICFTTDSYCSQMAYTMLRSLYTCNKCVLGLLELIKKNHFALLSFCKSHILLLLCLFYKYIMLY